MDSTYLRERRALARYLRAIREDSGISGNQLASRLGWAQSKVSRIETGRQLPSEGDLHEWADELGQPAATLGRLLVMLDQARSEYQSWKTGFAIAGGAAQKQGELRFLESRSHRIRSFQPLLVPGLLQTPAYAEELLHLPSGPGRFGASPDAIREMVEERMLRQRVLYDPAKEVTCLLLEAALTAGVCSAPTLLAQLGHLAALLAQDRLDVGIVPLAAPLPMSLFAGFDLFDSDVAVVEGLTGEHQISEPEEIAVYRDCFEELSRVAARGPDAALIVEKASDLVASQRGKEGGT